MKIQKSAQEEMVGFALIIVILAVIILIFFGFFINKSGEDLDSYEVESFVTALSHYTTECQGSAGNFLEIRELIKACERSNQECENKEEESCVVLNSTIKGLLDAGWRVTENSAVKGYLFKIRSNGHEIRDLPDIEKGNQTVNSRGSKVSLPGIEIVMDVFY